MYNLQKLTMENWAPGLTSWNFLFLFSLYRKISLALLSSKKTKHWNSKSQLKYTRNRKHIQDNKGIRPFLFMLCSKNTSLSAVHCVERGVGERDKCLIEKSLHLPLKEEFSLFQRLCDSLDKREKVDKSDTKIFFNILTFEE